MALADDLFDIDTLLSGGNIKSSPTAPKKHAGSEALLAKIAKEKANRYIHHALHTRLNITCTQCKLHIFVITDRRVAYKYSDTNKTSLVLQTEPLEASTPVQFRDEELIVPYCSACLAKGDCEQ